MGQRSARDIQPQGHLDHALETPHRPPTCHLQVHRSFSVRGRTLHGADVLAIIRGSQPNDSQVQTSTGQTISGQLCPPSIFLHLLPVQVLPASVVVHRFGDLIPDPPDLQAPNVHAGGQVTWQHDVLAHGGTERVAWSQHRQLSLEMEKDTVNRWHRMARGELRVSAARAISRALLCPPRGPKCGIISKIKVLHLKIKVCMKKRGIVHPWRKSTNPEEL